MARELAYTGRKFDAAEAREMRLVNRVFESPKAPLAVRGVKEMITYARDHTVTDGLNYNAT
jgi:enoyl-CoA hydratase